MGTGNAKFFVWQGASPFLKRVLDSLVLPLFKKGEQRSPNGINQRFRNAADPRLCLTLTMVMSVAVWTARPLALCLYLAVMGSIWTVCRLRQTAPPGALRSAIRFSLFWALCAFLVDGSGLLPALWAHAVAATTPDAPSLAVLGGEAATLLRASSLLFLRLFTLMLAALILTSLCSPRSLGLALTWFLRPFCREHAWKPALALALMAQYLPLILQTLHTTRTAFRSRGLPAQGPRYWLRALPHTFKLLADRTYSQAVAVISRGLDTETAWNTLRPLRAGEYALAAAGSGAILWLAFYATWA